MNVILSEREPSLREPALSLSKGERESKDLCVS
jgi:hypothetical protein